MKNTTKSNRSTTTTERGLKKSYTGTEVFELVDSIEETLSKLGNWRETSNLLAACLDRPEEDKGLTSLLYDQANRLEEIEKELHNKIAPYYTD